VAPAIGTQVNGSTGAQRSHWSGSPGGSVVAVSVSPTIACPATVTFATSAPARRASASATTMISVDTLPALLNLCAQLRICLPQAVRSADESAPMDGQRARASLSSVKREWSG
jgi:hypothetical protein